MISSDRPLTNPDDDVLGYRSFAGRLADSILSMTDTDGLVIGIHGEWGTGKSTLLEFVVQHLSSVADDNRRPIIVEFNPWWFSGKDDLIHRFLIHLQDALRNPVGKVMKDGLETVVKTLKRLTDVISASGLPASEVPSALMNVIPSFETHDVIQLKKVIGDNLKKSNAKVIVIIDDIDRLDADEIRQMFSLVKSVADFPNVVYLMSFDKAVVANALKAAHGANADAYIEKVVQIPFDLPKPNKSALSKFLASRLEILFAESGNAQENLGNSINIFNEVTKSFIDTPRDVIRLTNAMSLSYPLIRGEVNEGDFLGIESLRVFYPTIYAIVRDNQVQFAGSLNMYALSLGHEADSLRDFHQSWTSKEPSDTLQKVMPLLKRLFPKLENLERLGPTIHSELIRTWRKQKRICASELFLNYFSLNVSVDRLPSSIFEAILRQISDGKGFQTAILQLITDHSFDRPSYISQFLNRFQDHLDDVSVKDVVTVVTSLYLLADRLIAIEDMNSYPDNCTRITNIVEDLLLKLENSERLSVLLKLFKETECLSTQTLQVINLGHQFNKYGGSNIPPEDRLILSHVEDVETLEDVVLQNIKHRAQINRLIQTPGLYRILRFWEHKNAAEMKQWCNLAITDKESLLVFLEAFIQQSTSQVITDSFATVHYQLSSEILEQHVDLSLLVKQITVLFEEETPMSEKLANAVMGFLKELKDTGQSPKQDVSN